MGDVQVTINKGAIQAIITGPFAQDLERRAVQVESAAAGMCPVDTGRLRASITHTSPAIDGLGVFCLIGSDVEYAAFVEFGTWKMAAQPFLRPALSAA